VASTKQVLATLAILGGAALIFTGHEPTPDTAQAQPKSPRNGPASYSFKISVKGSDFPTITGTTNVPDGTQLLVNVKKAWLPDGQQRVARGLPACGDDCFPATAPDHRLIGVTTTVRNGRFTAGPFSFRGRPFAPGIYPLEISISVDPKKATLEEIRAMGTPIHVSTVRIGNPAPAAQAAPNSNWRWIKAANGLSYGIDINSIRQGVNGVAEAIVYIPEGNVPALLNVKRYLFDCRGQFMDMNSRGPMLPAPSNSVAGEMATVACARDTRFQ
jgi:hypothetical protein